MIDNKSINTIIGNYSRPVLIVEDKLENQSLLKGLCKKIKITCEIADNGKIGLEMSSVNDYAVYIVDLMMPVMDGKTFINELKKTKPESVIIVQTALDNPDTIIEIMKLAIFDYIIKPIEPELFVQTMLKALDYSYLKEVEKYQTDFASQKIRNQIDWLNYKESRRITEKDTAETKSIYSVKTSLAQGAGFGVLITLIDMLDSMKETSGENYIVPKEILNMLFENNNYCRTQLEGLNYATNIFEMDIELKPTTTADILEIINNHLKKLLPHFEKRGLKVTYPEMKQNYKLLCNIDSLKLTIEEIIINSYKYALPNSTVNFITHINEGYFWFSVKNAVKEKPYGGVPKEYEKLVIEPFFRINPPDESIENIEKIGFGLGLAIVDYIAKKHNGLFFIRDVVDMTTQNKTPCTMSEILIPVQE